MSIFDPYSPFLRFWRRNVNALEMESKMQPRRRRRRKMKYKTHLEHREKGLVLFHKNLAKSLFMNFRKYTTVQKFGDCKIFFYVLVTYTHQGSIYMTRNTVKTIIF